MTTETVADVVRLREILGDSPAARMLIELETLRAEKAAHAREVESLRLELDNERARGEHTCHAECDKPLCVMRRRAEAAEADSRRYRWLRDEAFQATAVRIVQMLPGHMDAAIDAAIACGGEDRKA